MSGNTEAVYVERVRTYSLEIATAIGALQPFLSDSSNSDPIPAESLRPIIEEPSFDQIVALNGAQVVGSAALSLIRGNKGAGAKGWLEDFVIHPDSRGMGVADKMADYWEQWYRDRGAKMLFFTSSWKRDTAHSFYLRRGAVIMNHDTNDETALFKYPIPKV